MATVDLTQAFSVVEGLGIVAGAAAGGLAAKRREDFDVFGVLGLATAGALGGGLLRDILIDRGPPIAFTNHVYLPLVLAVALVVSLVRGVELGPRGSAVIRVLDATAVGAFAVTAADRAHSAGFTIPACLFLGVIGGTGGLLMRDVLVADTPEIFRRGELNGIAALVAAAAFVLLIEAHVSRPIPSIVGIVVGFTLRLLALRFDWRAPAPRR